MKPTIEFYSFLQSAYDFFNKELFENQLPSVMFTITRKKNTCGFFRANGWTNEAGDKIHEIAVNPQYFITTSPLELSQTLVHEQTHLWQHEFGTPSRPNYHNTEWADKMRSIGLIPVSKNGKGTGQSVGDRPEAGGLFEQACYNFFLAGYKLALVDRQYNSEKTLQVLNKTIESRIKDNKPLSLATTTSETSEVAQNLPNSTLTPLNINISQPISELYNIEVPDDATKPTYSTKTTYKCPNCGFKVWGAFGLPIGCLDCHTALLPIKKS